MKRIFFFLALICCFPKIWGQFSLSINSYSQDFNTLVNSGSSAVLPTGWSISESGSAANTSYTAGTGSMAIGDTYSFGVAAPSVERALGGLRSGSLIPLFGFYFTNNTGNVIIGLSLSYSGETWRVGSANRSDRLDFQYSLNATNLGSGSWIDWDPLDYANPGQATGNSSLQHTAVISSAINGLSIANGSSLFIRWSDLDALGADDGMAIDDLSLTVTAGIAAPVSLLSFAGRKEDNQNRLSWATAGEYNNRGFEVQRSYDGINYSAIGFVNSKATGGNSTAELSYSFTDYNQAALQYYRLLQIDLDNRSKASDIILIRLKPMTIPVRLFPNPANDCIHIMIDSDKPDDIGLLIYDIAGRVVSQKRAHIEPGSNTINVGIADLGKGNYIIRLFDTPVHEIAIASFIRQ